MAIPTPRVIFACAIPAIIVILSYIWFKRKKEVEDRICLEDTTQKSQQYHAGEIAYRHTPESDFQKFSPQNSQPPVKMVFETAIDKEDPRLGKGGEECEESEGTETDLQTSSSGLYHEVKQKALPPLMQLPSQYGEPDGFPVPVANIYELRDVARNVTSCIESLALQSPVPRNGKQLELVESVNDIKKYLVLHETGPKDSVLTDGGTILCVDMSKDSAILECKQDLKLASQVDSQVVEHIQEGHQDLKPTPVEDSQDSLEFESSLDMADTSIEDSQGSLDVEGLTNVKPICLDGSQCSLDVVGTPNFTQSTLDDSQCYLDVEGFSDVNDDEPSPAVEFSPLKGSQLFTPDMAVTNQISSTVTPPAPTEVFLCSSDVGPQLLEGSADVEHAPIEDSPKIASSSLEGFLGIGPTPSESTLDTEPTLESFLDMEPTLESSLHTEPTLESSYDVVHTHMEGFRDIEPPRGGSPQMEHTPDVVSNLQESRPEPADISKQIEDSSLATSLCAAVEKDTPPVSFLSATDMEPTFSAGSLEEELTLESEGHYDEVASDSCSTCTFTTTLIEMEDSPTEVVSSWSDGGDGDPGAVCGPASLPDFSIAASDQVELELNEGRPVPSPGLPADDAELHKLVNCNSISAYGSSSHSPADDLLESPTTSNYSDLHSEGSSDSGKGGSDIHTPNVEGGASNFPYTALQVYEFEIPQDLCGRLIGVRGRYVNLIKCKSRANISIKRHPFNPAMKLCAVIGTEDDINIALALIRKRFPISKFPDVNIIQINSPLINGIPVPETLQLHLPDGVTCDVILSSLVSAGHFFIQQPTHPTYSSLSRLDHFMLQCYQDGARAPKLPTPVEAGIICAASTMGGWYRAQVVYVYPDCDECEVKFVDYGGYSRESIAALRQIRSDFMSLPFQASECFLANVAPIDESQGWSLEAISCFEEMAQGQILQAQTVSYSEDGIPYVHLYRIQGVTTTFINRQLVSSGFAKWLDNQA